MFQLNHLYY